ncbi:MAG: hypothetical protein ABI367_11005 [Mucilaginibacter sp.]
MDNQDKPPITGISEDTFLKILDPDGSFKRSNWLEWLANEKSKRTHDKWVIGYAIFTICFLSIVFLYAGYINLINKEAMTGLLGTVAGAGLSFFIKYIGKSESKK